MLKPETVPAREEGATVESVMSIEDFVDLGLEPGQRGLVWDFVNHRYVAVSKPTRPALNGIVPGLLGMVHSLAAISLTGGVIQ